MTALKENILIEVKKKPSVWWRYIHNTLFVWEYDEVSLKKFINEINPFNETIKFTVDWSKEKVNFLDVKVNLQKGVL